MSFTGIIGGGVFSPSGLPDPSTVSGLELWLDGNLGITFGIPPFISNWADQSGNGHDFAQASAVDQPAQVVAALDGNNGLSFGAGDHLSAVTVMAASIPTLTLYSVWRTTIAPAATGMMFSHRDSTTPLIQSGTFTGPAHFIQQRDSLGTISSIFPGPAFTNGTYTLSTDIWDAPGAFHSVQIDGGVPTTDAVLQTGTVISTVELIGADDDGVGGLAFSWGITGPTLTEMIGYLKTLSVAEDTVVRNYLKNKYPTLP